MEKEKTIIRTSKRENPYVLLDKTFLNETNLSWKAKGLMAFLLSKPDDWQIMIGNLVNQSPDGRDAVYSTIKELIQFGYMVKKKIRDGKGRFLGFEYIVYEIPQEPNVKLEKKDTEIGSNSGARNNDLEKTSLNPFPAFPYTDYPDTDFPDTGCPDTENPTLLSNDLLLNNDFTKNPPSHPPGFTDNQKTEGEGVKISLEEVQILEPVAMALFGQYNLQIASRLKDQIREFEIDEECVQECLKSIDAGKIRHNPYAYFRIKYMVAIAAMAERKKQQALIEKDEGSLQEFEKPSADYMIRRFRELREQLTKT